MAEKLVIYDSFFGNTEKIAHAIGEALGDADVIKLADASKEHLEGVKILIIGSPTRIFRPSPATTGFLKSLAPNGLAGVTATAFDTRIPSEKTDSKFLKTLIKLFGYADTKIAKGLKRAGANLAIPSAGFGVSDTEGPLVEGELERARDWAKTIL